MDGGTRNHALYRKGRHLVPVTVVFCTGKDSRWRLLPALLVDEGAPYEAAHQLRMVAGAEAVEFPWHGVQSLWVLLRYKGTTFFESDTYKHRKSCDMMRRGIASQP